MPGRTGPLPKEGGGKEHPKSWSRVRVGGSPSPFPPVSSTLGSDPSCPVFPPHLLRFTGPNRPDRVPFRNSMDSEGDRLPSSTAIGSKRSKRDEGFRTMEPSTCAASRAIRHVRPSSACVGRFRRRVAARAEPGDVVGEGERVPWHVGTYFSKRKQHRHDRMGRIDEAEDDANVMQPLFDAHAQEALAVRVVAKECGLGESVVASRLARLRSLLPDVGEKWKAMKAADLARLAVDVEGVAKAMVRLKTAMPNANVSVMVAKQPGLLYWDVPRLERAVQGARALLPNVRDFDALVEKNPLVLQVEQLEEGLNELRRLAPKQDVENMLERDPNLLLNVQSGSDMIPYDNGSLEQLEQTLRGGPDAAPSGW